MKRPQVWLIDFEDSFTYNVAAELEQAQLDCRVISWTKLKGAQEQEFKELPGLIVLGPGPGHPDEYHMDLQLRAWWNTGVALAGICLGHQLLGRMLGMTVDRSLEPKHGEKISLSVPTSFQQLGIPEKIQVQRYNSLAVKVAGPLPTGWEGWEQQGEYLGFKHQRAISYQFHPESVGTSCPRALFSPLRDLAI